MKKKTKGLREGRGKARRAEAKRRPWGKKKKRC